MQPATTSRLAHIDSIRAIAALLVVFIHCSAVVYVTPPKTVASSNWFDWLIQTADFGRVGVVMFFTVSGFVVPSSLKQGQKTSDFWIRRFFRLYPAYWASLLLAVIAHRVITGENYPHWEIVANTTMLQNFLHVENIEGVYWTLKLELFFYGACYFLFLLRLAGKAWVLEIIALGFSAIYLFYLDYWSGPIGFSHHLLGSFASQTPSPGSTDPTHHPIPGLLNMNWGNFCAYFAAMFIGAILRQWHDQNTGRLENAVIALLLLFWAIGVPVLASFVWARTHDIGLFSAFVSIPLGIVLFAIFAFFVRITNRLVVRLGVISYSLYLLHPLVIDSVVAIDARWKLHWFDRNSGVLLILCATLSIALSIAMFKQIESPAIALGRRLAPTRLKPPVD